jgi:hypothetical protein
MIFVSSRAMRTGQRYRHQKSCEDHGSDDLLSFSSGTQTLKLDMPVDGRDVFR